MTKNEIYYKKYFNCIKCGEKYGTDNPHEKKARRCPLCASWDKGSKLGVIKRIYDRRKDNV